MTTGTAPSLPTASVSHPAARSAVLLTNSANTPSVVPLAVLSLVNYHVGEGPLTKTLLGHLHTC